MKSPLLHLPFKNPVIPTIAEHVLCLEDIDSGIEKASTAMTPGSPMHRMIHRPISWEIRSPIQPAVKR